MGSVSKRDWSLWGKWSAIGGRLFVRVVGRSGWAATSRDTTSIRAKVLAVESGMDTRSGRVKGGAPDGELGNRPCRESFHDEHGGGALWTTEAGGLGEGGMGQCECMGFGVVQQQPLTVGQEFCALTIGQESEGTDANKAAGQNVQQETAQELLRGERACYQ